MINSRNVIEFIFIIFIVSTVILCLKDFDVFFNDNKLSFSNMFITLMTFLGARKTRELIFHKKVPPGK